MRETRLCHYPEYTVDQHRFKGGNQEWFEKPDIKNYGCGLVAAEDFLLCLSGDKIDLKDYLVFGDLLERHYTRVRKWIGVTGFSLARGINRYAECHELKIRAKWGIKRTLFSEIIQDMLAQNIPVILGIGRDLRWGVQKRGVRLSNENKPHCPVYVHGHYVTVTGFKEGGKEPFESGGKYHASLLVASWGNEYRMDFDELCRYMDSQPVGIRYLLSNILYVTKAVRD